MVRPVFTGQAGEEVEYNTRRQLQSTVLQKLFLRECLAEKVLPKTVSHLYRSSIVPFPHSAYVKLKEDIEQLTLKAIALREQLPGVHLPHHLVLSLRTEYEVQAASHRRKLQVAIDASPWSKVVRDDLIINLSHKPLTTLQSQALSLGLKCDVGECRRDLMDVINSNYYGQTSDIDRGFAQGIAVTSLAAAKQFPVSFPRRFMKTLKEMGKDFDLAIVPADRGGSDFE